MQLTTREIQRLSLAFERNDFTYILGFFAAMERAYNYPLLNKFSAAIQRIETVFEKVFHIAAWPPEWSTETVQLYRAKIAGYVASAGSAAPFIDDLRAANGRGLRPNGLKYFLFTKNAASRWDLLLDKIYNRRWKEQKRQEQTGLNRTSDNSPREVSLADILGTIGAK